MTPAARYAAAIDILDTILSGEPAERVLTNWARSNRFAGSGDRGAIRDIVFEVLRKKQSCTVHGGSLTGRGMVLGLLRQEGINPDQFFNGARFAPAPLSDPEKAHRVNPAQIRVSDRLDFPAWLEPNFRASLGQGFEETMARLRTRAPVFVRVNTRKGSVADAVKSLKADEIQGVPHILDAGALEVTENARKISASGAYRSGLVELQDVASQAVVSFLDLPREGDVLDYCAGGGGKTLAMAARTEARILAHDVDVGRMRDLPERARRAGVDIRMIDGTQQLKRRVFDFVLCDVPCSGSGAWRRAPSGKWALSPARLEELLEIQRDILRKASEFVRPGGRLAFATCSLLLEENQQQIERFLNARTLFKLEGERQFTPLDGGDGLYVAQLKRDE